MCRQKSKAENNARGLRIYTFRIRIDLLDLSLLIQVKFMHRLRSPYTVQFYEWFETSNHLWLILEYCPGGRLMDLIQASQQRGLSSNSPRSHSQMRRPRALRPARRRPSASPCKPSRPQADLKLPEANVRILGLNLLAALQVPSAYSFLSRLTSPHTHAHPRLSRLPTADDDSVDAAAVGAAA